MTHDVGEHADSAGSAGERLAEEIRRLRKAADLSQSQLAAKIGYSPQYVSLAERPGKGIPSAAVVNAIDNALGADGALTALGDRARAEQQARRHSSSAEPSSPDQTTRVLVPIQVNGQTLLLPATLNGEPVDMPTADGAVVLRSASPTSQRTGGPPMRAELLTHYEALTDNFRQIDYQMGAQAIYADTVAHLGRLLTAADQVPSFLYRRFVLDLGDIAQLAAWLAIDRQHYGPARQFCALALSSAEEGEDPNLHAYVLGVMSYIHLHAGRGTEAFRLLEAALRIADTTRLGVEPVVQSWLYEAMGEAHALVGQRSEGTHALARAEQLFDRVRTDTVPPWLSFFNSVAHAARLQGRCLMRLGERRAAIMTLEAACDLLPAHFVRERSGTLIDLAAAHLLDINTASNAAEPDAAATNAAEAWRLAALTESNRNRRRIQELMPAFGPYLHLESVQTLQETVR